MFADIANQLAEANRLVLSYLIREKLCSVQAVLEIRRDWFQLISSVHLKMLISKANLGLLSKLQDCYHLNFRSRIELQTMDESSFRVDRATEAQEMASSASCSGGC